MLEDLWCFLRFMGAPPWFGDWYWPDGISRAARSL